jgi:predicted RNase H-like nuclease (RuvC/YqgF family)
MMQQIELQEARRTIEKLQQENKILRKNKATDRKEISDLRDHVERLATSLKAVREASIEPDEYARVVRRGVAMESRIRELERLYAEQLQIRMREKIRADEGKESRTLGTQWYVADYRGEDYVSRRKRQRIRKSIDNVVKCFTK